MTDAAIEQEIQANGANVAPRITPADVEANIVAEHYFVGGDGLYGAAHKRGDHSVQTFGAALDLLTFCILGSPDSRVERGMTMHFQKTDFRVERAA